MAAILVSPEISLASPIYTSAGQNPYPHFDSELISFIDSRMFLAYVVREACNRISEIPYAIINLWFQNSIANEEKPSLRSAELDRYEDCLAIRPPVTSEAGREMFAEPLLNVHAQLRNIRRELLREIQFGPQTSATLLALSRIVRDCIYYFADVAKNTGCVKALVKPFDQLRHLRRRLSLITTKTKEQILSVSSYEADVLQPFSEVVSRFHETRHIERRTVPWREELSTAMSTGDKYAVEAAPSRPISADFKPWSFDFYKSSDADKKVLKQIVHRFIARTGAASLDDFTLRTPFPRNSVVWAADCLAVEGLIKESNGYFTITLKGVRRARRRSLFLKLFQLQ